MYVVKKKFLFKSISYIWYYTIFIGILYACHCNIQECITYKISHLITYTLSLPQTFLVNAIRKYPRFIDWQLFLLVTLCKHGLIGVHTSLCLFGIIYIYNAYPIEAEWRYTSVNQATFASDNVSRQLSTKPLYKMMMLYWFTLGKR